MIEQISYRPTERYGLRGKAAVLHTSRPERTSLI